jgi:hypothetical protein
MSVPSSIGIVQARRKNQDNAMPENRRIAAVQKAQNGSETTFVNGKQYKSLQRCSIAQSESVCIAKMGILSRSRRAGS